jgi:hypothetical protein
MTSAVFRRAASIAALAITALALLASAAQAQDDPDPNTFYNLKFKHSQKCLDVPDGSMLDGVALQQFECHAWGNQAWRWEYTGFRDTITGRSYYWIRNARSGKCVSIADGSLYDGARIVQSTCRVVARTLFAVALHYVGTGYMKLMNYASEKCLNVSGASFSDHAAIIQYRCAASWPQSEDNMLVRWILL